LSSPPSSAAILKKRNKGQIKTLEIFILSAIISINIDEAKLPMQLGNRLII
jgi:hypothetical protein